MSEMTFVNQPATDLNQAAIPSNQAGWTTAAMLAGRLIFALVFIMAVSFKLMNISATAGYIASEGSAVPVAGLARRTA